MKTVPSIHDVPKDALYAAKQANGSFLCYFEADRASLPASVFPPVQPEVIAPPLDESRLREVLQRLGYTKTALDAALTK